MKNQERVSLVILLLLFQAALNPTFGQGSLTPPGPPGPTLKTLEQIEPRKPISSLPFTITAPGSYYLTTNLTGGANQSGITISADDVTLELGGFTLFGRADARYGIVTTGSRTNLVIRNGSIVGWGDDGVNANGAHHSLFEQLRAMRNGTGGLSVGQSCRLIDCHAEANAWRGINCSTNGIIDRCVALNNGVVGNNPGIHAGDGSVVQNCLAAFNVSSGIVAFRACVVTRCIARNNGNNGIAVTADCFVIENTATGNGTNPGFPSAAGISASGSGNRLEANHANGNPYGFQVNFVSTTNLVLRNSAAGNSTGNYNLRTGGLNGSILTAGTLVTNMNPHANFSF